MNILKLEWCMWFCLICFKLLMLGDYFFCFDCCVKIDLNWWFFEGYIILVVEMDDFDEDVFWDLD